MGNLGFDVDMRQELEAIVSYGHSVRQLKRAQALLWVDDGESISQVARRLRTTRQTIHNWIHRIDLDRGSLAECLQDAPRRGRPRTKTEVFDEVIPQLLASTPGQQGYRATGWTNRLLRVYLKRHHQLSVSRRTVQLAIRRAGYRWKRPRYVCVRRSPTWRQAKGGSNAV